MAYEHILGVPQSWCIFPNFSEGAGHVLLALLTTWHAEKVDMLAIETGNDVINFAVYFMM